VKFTIAPAVLACLSASAASQTTPAPVAQAETLRLTLAIAEWQPLRFEAVHGVILVQATLNGRPATLLVDNGSARTLVDRAAAAQTGLRLSARPGGLQTGTARMATQLAEGLALDIPHVLAIHGSLPAADLSGMSAALGRPIAGVLGGDVLNRLAVLIRPAESTIGLVASGGVNPSAKAPRIPVLAGRVTAVVDGHPVRLAIDLGFNGAVRLTDAVWATLPGAAVASDRTDATGARSATQVKRASFALGNVTTPAVPVDSGFAGADGVDGLLGFGFFSHAVTAIDATRGWLVIEPLNIPVSELPAKVRPH
jgi:hypothetical protein